MFKIPFSGNSKVIDLWRVIGLQRVEDFPKHIPKKVMSATLLKGSPLHPRPNHTKDALYSTSGWSKESKYFTSFRLLNLNLCRKITWKFTMLKWTSKWVFYYFLHCHFKTPCIIIIVQNFYTSACFLSRDTTFYIEPCQLLV